MSGKAGLIVGIVAGVIGAIALFCLTISIGCAANGLTFGEQICEWFGNNASEIAGAIPQDPIV